MNNRTEQVGSIISVFDEIKAALAASVMRVLVDPEEVDDILQETFLQVYNQNSRGEIRSLKGYFFRVARNITIKNATLKRRLKINSIEDLTGFEPLSDNADAEETLHYVRKYESFIEIANSLPKKSRQAFLLKKVAGLSQKQIAKKMGISESTVEKHLIAAMHRTVNEMNKRGYNVKKKNTRLKTSKDTMSTQAEEQSYVRKK